MTSAARAKPLDGKALAQRLERELAAEVAVRFDDQDPSGVRAKLVAATFLAVLRVSLNVWLEHPAERRFWDVARDSLEMAGRGFAVQA